jgi:hypothetical protein
MDYNSRRLCNFACGRGKVNRKERTRDVFPVPPDADYWSARAREGWRLVAAEWEREHEQESADTTWVEEVPYGMKVGDDCLHLVENPEEKEALTLMLEMLIADKPFSEVAECVNACGFHTRAGAGWTQVDIFNLLPRLVEIAPRLYPTHDWAERRKRIYNAAR